MWTGRLLAWCPRLGRAAAARVAAVPRCPLAGAALCAAAGILVADAVAGGPGGAAPLPAAEGFGALTLAAGLVWGWRRRAGWCWLLVAAGFACTHAARLADPPGAALERWLAAAPPEPGPAGVGTGAGASDGVGAGAPEDHPPALRVRAGLRLESTPAGPRGRAGPARARARLEWLGLADESWDAAGARVQLRWPAGRGVPALGTGDRVEVTGIARNLVPPRNPGQPDFAALLRRQGVRSEIRVETPADLRRVARGGGPASALARCARRTHDWIAAVLGRGLAGTDPPAAAVLPGLVLGLGEGDADPLRRGAPGRALQATGTLHFFAVDGLKVGLLAALGGALLRAAGLPPRVAAGLTLPALGFYALVTGLGPASVRALLTAAVFLLGRWRERPARSANGLGAAATLILALDTQQLFARGFQLSFVVVGAILWFGPGLTRAFGRWGAPDPFVPRALRPPGHAARESLRRHLAGLAGVSTAAWLGSLPFTLGWFHQFSPVSVPANLVSFPFAWGVLALDLSSLLAAAAGAGAAPARAWVEPLNRANVRLAAGWLGLVEAAAAVPPPLGAQWVEGAWPASRPRLELTVLALEDGSRALHLRAGGADWLFDGGRAWDGPAVVTPYLQTRGIGRLDGLWWRQADAAHLGAAGTLLDEFRPRRVLGPPQPPAAAASSSGGRRRGGRSPAGWTLSGALAARGVVPEEPGAGEAVSIAPGVEVRVLATAFPSAAGGRGPGRSPDGATAVLQVRVNLPGGRGRADAPVRALLTADLGATGAARLLAGTPAGELASEVWVLGAHPREVSDPPELIEAVRPRVVVYERAGPDGEYPLSLPDERWAAACGHPVAVYRTARDGAVRLRVWPDGRIEAGSVR